ncbi:hypothetical protein Ahy_B02g059587 [Arachis hypogaea]|uniref:Uncharacterized protein n=1 Tax=Arachis hypogaea TaxID=3818 RepID=A0A445AGW5_ARAHY|nr:hypothetical protein Ahy_B02g059587 [Arachis hypogaea]
MATLLQGWPLICDLATLFFATLEKRGHRRKSARFYEGAHLLEIWPRFFTATLEKRGDRGKSARFYIPVSPIPSLAVTPAVARSPTRNSPVTRSRTPKPSPIVLLGTHPSPVVLRGSCSRYRPPRYNAINSCIPLHPSPSSLKLCIYFSYLQTTALMLAFSEHLRDNYSLATYGCDYTFYDHNHPEELPLELKHSFKIVVADPPYLVKSKRDEILGCLDNSSFVEKVVPSGSRAVHCCDNSLFLKQNHISRGITFSREVKILWDLNWVKDG